MARIPPVMDDTDDEDARAVLGDLQKRWGAAPNVARTLANNPKILEAFLALWFAVEESGLSGIDREVVCMEMAASNECHYCVPAHRMASQRRGVDPEIVEAIVRGEALEGDGREAVIQRLVRDLQKYKGGLPDDVFAAYQKAGITPADMIAVIAEIAHCVLTNYSNRLAETDLDPYLEPFREPLTA